jgi:acyl-CoA synthetase (AMP-forming)/AMP-acid ligase II
VVGLPDAKWGERVVAAVIPESDAQLSPESVTAHCRSLIAGYKVPKQILFVESLPLTPTGKVRKAALRELLLAAGQA